MLSGICNLKYADDWQSYNATWKFLNPKTNTFQKYVKSGYYTLAHTRQHRVTFCFWSENCHRKIFESFNKILIIIAPLTGLFSWLKAAVISRRNITAAFSRQKSYLFSKVGVKNRLFWKMKVFCAPKKTTLFICAEFNN